LMAKEEEWVIWRKGTILYFQLLDLDHFNYERRN
jgi:hypothetical protein